MPLFFCWHQNLSTSSFMALSLSTPTFACLVVYVILTSVLQLPTNLRLVPHLAFVGYPSNHKGYRCHDILSQLLIISCHVVFDESVFLHLTFYCRMLLLLCLSLHLRVSSSCPPLRPLLRLLPPSARMSSLTQRSSTLASSTYPATSH